MFSVLRLRVRVNAVVLELPGNFPLLGSIERGLLKRVLIKHNVCTELLTNPVICAGVQTTAGTTVACEQWVPSK